MINTMKPVTLLYWMRKWELADTLCYKKAAEMQACFVRDKICGNLLKSCGFVVNTHMSKSCELPVYYVKLRNGIKLTMRNNFYDWKMSVEIPDAYDNLPVDYLPLDCLSHRMVERPIEAIAPCYLEGFKTEWCYGAYDPQNPSKKFTIEIPDNERLYVIVHCLKHAYPDVVFNVEDDKRSMEDITKAIDAIYDTNGYNDWEEEKFLGKTTKRRVMSGWEILWRTYCKIDDLYHDNKISVERVTTNGTPKQFAEAIGEFPEVHQEFLLEEWLFN